MNSLDLINKLYKPYRITKLASVTIIDAMEGKFVIKNKKDKDIKSLYNYLKTRGFYEYANLVDDSRSEINIFEYIEGAKYPLDQKAQDLVKLVASLHSKTVYSKEVREDKFKEIYDNLKNNLEYYKNEYSKLADICENEVFMSPSHYLFIRNSSKLFAEIKFCESELDKWYDSIRDKREIRVCTIHNNINLNHFIKGEKEVLISWDKYLIDSPILDIYGWYQVDALNVEFNTLLKIYQKYFPLEKSELDLLLIMISMPREIKFSSDEFKSCESIRESLDYVFKTEELVRPYYLKDDKVEK